MVQFLLFAFGVDLGVLCHIVYCIFGSHCFRAQLVLLTDARCSDLPLSAVRCRVSGIMAVDEAWCGMCSALVKNVQFLPTSVHHIYLTTRLTLPVDFSRYFQNYERYLNESFEKVREIYQTGSKSKIMRLNHFVKYLGHLNTATLIFKRRTIDRV